MCVTLSTAVGMIIAASLSLAGISYALVTIIRYESELTQLRRALRLTNGE